MRYFTFWETIRAALAFFLLGIFFGIGKKSLFDALTGANRLWQNLEKRINSALKLNIKIKIFAHFGKLLIFLIRQTDELVRAVYTFFLGLGYALCSYVFLDGAIRLYGAALLLLGFFLADRTVGFYVARLCRRVARFGILVLHMVSSLFRPFLKRLVSVLARLRKRQKSI